MTTGDQISELIRASFPVDPLPDEFWLADVIRRPLDDIAEELQNRIAERSWPEITIRDWALIGASPDVVRRYLTPNAFRYYLPSSLVGVLRDIGYVEWALDSILPNNQKRCPKRVSGGKNIRAAFLPSSEQQSARSSGVFEFCFGITSTPPRNSRSLTRKQFGTRQRIKERGRRSDR